MFNRIRRAYLMWHIRMVTAEIRDTLRDQKDAEICGEVTEVLELESYLQRLQATRRSLQARLARVSQPTRKVLS